MTLKSKGWKFALALGMLMAACVSAPEQPDPTVAQVTFTAAEDANPDPAGRASPTAVYVYALQPGAPFATASSDDLLGGQVADPLIRRIAQVVMVPGRKSKKIFTLPEGTSDIGIAVAYRDIDTAKWREQVQVTPNSVTLIKAGIGTNEITVE